MREILFRGKRIDSGDWVEGAYFKHLKRQPGPVGDRVRDDDVAHLIIKGGFADWNMPRPIEAVEIAPDTVGQFTGLLDKNGKRIFEGDIVRNGVLGQFLSTICFGEYQPDEFCRYMREVGGYTNIIPTMTGFYAENRKDGRQCFLPGFDYMGKTIEIIGTIHDKEPA